MDKQILVSLDLIDPNPYQPRHVEDPEAVAELAQSIKHNGLMQVPTARQVNGRHQLAFGHTRLASYKFNGEACMPLIVRELTDLQMFELGVAENIKRRDLNYVEKAESLRRYMDEFGKTSAEAAEFFNTTEEDVRGTVRLDNLIEPAKEKLAEGKITVTTGRTVLSMQKIVPTDVVVKTLERLEKGTDRWGNTERPEEAIDEVLGQLDDLKELWSREGKPRGGSSDAWLLDMKNFPNHFLPQLTAVDIAMALGIQDNEDALKLVDEYLQYVEAESAAFHDGRPGSEDKDYIASCTAQEQRRIDALSKTNPEYGKRILHLIKPPACTACPFHAVVQGTHYCGMKPCFSRKTRAWEYEKLRAASKALKIEIYNKETDGEFRVLEDNYNSKGNHYELFKKSSKDLRLALAVDIDRKKPQYGYKLPSSVVVIVTGKTLKGLLETGQKERAAKRTKEQAAKLLRNLRTEKREALDWELAFHAAALFTAMNLAALDALWNAPGRYSSNEWQTGVYNAPVAKPSDDDNVPAQEEFLRRVLALNMVKKIYGYYGMSETMSEYASQVSEKVKSWGVKLPKSITKMAAQMDEEIAAVTVETE